MVVLDAKEHFSVAGSKSCINLYMKMAHSLKEKVKELIGKRSIVFIRLI